MYKLFVIKSFSWFDSFVAATIQAIDEYYNNSTKGNE